MSMALDEPEAEEKSLEINGINVLISEPVIPHIEGTLIDYLKENGRESFVLTGSGCEDCDC